MYNALRRRSLMISFYVAIIAALGVVYVFYLRDMQSLRDRLVLASNVIETQYGSIEYASWGEGPAVLALHGAGGGYDQGRLLANTMGGDGYHWISISRFGYLRSTLPPDPSTPAQADAIAALLDTLGVDRVSILAMSGGAPPTLQFALRHPERTNALVLLSSAPYTPFTADKQDLPVPIWIYQALFGSDLPYWILEKVARQSIEGIFDVKPGLRATLTAAEKTFVAEIISAFEPVTARAAGVRNEGAAIDPLTLYPIGLVSAPTLIIHAQDDGINPYAIAQGMAEGIPGAELVSLPTGGHLLLGHHAEIRESTRAFLRKHAFVDKQ